MNLSYGWVPVLGAVFMTLATIGLGLWATKRSTTASDFFVAGRSVSVFWNASAISGEYLSAASFMGIAGLLMKNGYDALWYPACYAAGYLFLLLFIAGPLRRFGAYTIPDFAEGRFDSPAFRKVAVTFVLFIGFFYTMPQMKGAGVTLGAIMNWPYFAGIAVVGLVITFNVAFGGMKGITLVQAFQYWAKMFAISVPIFVLAAVFGHYPGNLEKIRSSPNSGPRYSSIQEMGIENSYRNAEWNSVQWIIQEPKDSSRPRFVAPAEGGFGRFLKAVKIVGLRNIKPESKGAKSRPALFIREPKEKLLSVESNDLGGDIVLGGEPRNGFSKGAMVHSTGEAPFDVAAGSIFEIVGDTMLEFSSPTTIELEVNMGIPNAPKDSSWISAFGPMTSKHGYPLLYTYSLIIALICGTAGLPHILVRFYTNPDGRAAKRTTLWVMVMLGAFYVFPPIWGTLGRLVQPIHYLNGTTDKIVITLPRAHPNALIGADPECHHQRRGFRGVHVDVFRATRQHVGCLGP